MRRILFFFLLICLLIAAHHEILGPVRHIIASSLAYQHVLPIHDDRQLRPIRSFKKIATTLYSKDNNDLVAQSPAVDEPSVIVHNQPSRFRYRILKSHHVVVSSQEETDTTKTPLLLPLLVDIFDFSSRSQARKACRQGEIVLLRGQQRRAGDNKDDDRFLLPLRIEEFVIESTPDIQLDNNRPDGGFIFVNPGTTTSVQMGDVLCRITRCNSSYYPVELTGFVTPPQELKNCSGLEIVYEDEYMAIVNKPENLTTVGGVNRNDLQSFLPFCLTPPPQWNLTTTTNPLIMNMMLPRPVHRLDRRTSGLVVVAKVKPVLRALSLAFEQRRVQKTYTALVLGQIHHDDLGCIDYPILGKPAISNWRVLQRGKNLTLIQVQPKTGRNHQIRRHLSYCLGTPILGDNKYDNGNLKELRHLGLFLCSTAISLVHPITQTELSVSIPLPSKFHALLSREAEFLAAIMDKDRANDDDDNDETLEKYVLRLREEIGKSV